MKRCVAGERSFDDLPLMTGRVPTLPLAVTSAGGTRRPVILAPMKATPDIHVFGAFVHGVLVAFHGLGCLYNKKRGNDLQTWLHLGVGLYDLWAVNQHIRGINDCQ